MDNLISLIIDLLTALFSGSKKKDKPDNSSAQASRPDPSRPRVPQRPTAWEEELRRLLEGQSQPSPAPPPPRQPATLVPQTPRVITVMTPPVVVTRPVSAYSPAPAISPPPLPSGFASPSQSLASLSESKLAYDRASQLDKTAASRIDRVPGQEVQLTSVIRQPVSAEVMQVVALFKSPSAARQAVIASVIFGPPRAFEEQTSASF